MRFESGSGMFSFKKASMQKLCKRKACSTFPVLERKGDHLRSRWWKVECCMFERRKGCCCTQYFLLYMKKPCATSTPRKLSGKVFADLPFDVKALTRIPKEFADHERSSSLIPLCVNKGKHADVLPLKSERKPTGFRSVV